MTQRELDNLVRIGQLKCEASAKAELEGLLRSGSRRLNDAERSDLCIESRFDLTYGSESSNQPAARSRPMGANGCRKLPAVSGNISGNHGGERKWPRPESRRSRAIGAA
jgi:hypothetical protein